MLIDLGGFMKRSFQRTFAAVGLILAAAMAFAQEKATVTILETSDIHGSIAPWDYATDKFDDKGLAKVATVINAERAKDPTLLLVDCGDNLQDNLIQEFRNEKISPMVGAMNLLGYDAHILGNHEFNFEFKNLQKNIKTFKAPVVNANIYKGKKRWVNPYIIKEVNGVKVAIIGIVAPHIDRWEASNPEHFKGLRFTLPMEEVGKTIEEIGDKADVMVVVSHYGVDGEYGCEGMGPVSNKYADKIPVFLVGHAHSVLSYTTPAGALIVEPGSKGSHVAKVTMDFEKVDGKWKLTEKKGELLPVAKANIEPDKTVMDYIQPTHEKSRAIANTVVGKVGADFLPSLWWNGLNGIPTATLQDTAMIDLINKVQMEVTGADVSLAALFDSTSDLPAGDFRKRDGVKIYKYDNTLMAVKITGKQLKAIMEEQGGKFFNQFKPGDVTISFNENIRMYMYDMFAGVDYEVDISEPVGKRIKNVMYKGAPLKDDQSLILALNNYRYGGLSSAGFISDSTAPDVLVYNTGVAIRDKISDYVVEHGSIMPECDNNWKITGYEFAPEAEQVYALVREGKIKVPASADGRTPNVKSLNVNELKAAGLLK